MKLTSSHIQTWCDPLDENQPNEAVRYNWVVHVHSTKKYKRSSNALRAGRAFAKAHELEVEEEK